MEYKEKIKRLLDKAETNDKIWKIVQKILADNIGDYEGGMKSLYFLAIMLEKREAKNGRSLI